MSQTELHVKSRSVKWPVKQLEMFLYPTGFQKGESNFK